MIRVSDRQIPWERAFSPHRFPGSTAMRVQAMCRAVVERYDGDVAAEAKA